MCPTPGCGILLRYDMWAWAFSLALLRVSSKYLADCKGPAHFFYGRIYYVISSRIRLLCIIDKGAASDCLCLNDINSDSAKIEVHYNEVRAVWDLCGVYKHFDRR